MSVLQTNEYAIKPASFACRSEDLRVQVLTRRMYVSNTPQATTVLLAGHDIFMLIDYYGVWYQSVDGKDSPKNLRVIAGLLDLRMVCRGGAPRCHSLLCTPH